MAKMVCLLGQKGAILVWAGQVEGVGWDSGISQAIFLWDTLIFEEQLPSHENWSEPFHKTRDEAMCVVSFSMRCLLSY